LGFAIAQRMLASGARVTVWDRDAAGMGAAAEQLRSAQSGAVVYTVQVDVASHESVVQATVQTTALAGVDVLVNSAGFTKPIPHADLDALDDDFIDRMFEVNWRGQFATIRTFAPMLKASGDGLIVSISSIAALNGNGSNIAYGAVKAGIDAMTKSLGRALAPEIRVMGVAPGMVATTFVAGRGPESNAKAGLTTPLRRVADPEDVAAAVLSCATHLGYSTGSTLIIDGGRAL
jgi:3-oxoacyl-[acyl-carrier protein] reductase